jgi:hypothetical protein
MNLLDTPKYSQLNQPLDNNRVSLKDLFYTYRLTYIDSLTGQKFYYMGWHTESKKDPREDGYFSSSKIVKNLYKKHGAQYLKKKILGIYSTSQEALEQEIKYHARLKVDKTPRFLNQARQTSTGFYFDNTGRVQTEESNKKRLDALIGLKKHSEEGKKAISQYQREIRIRSEEELTRLRQTATARNQQEAICPYCGQIGKSFLAMKRWHFENCKKAPNPSPQSLQDREKLKKRFLTLNKNHPKRSKIVPPPPSPELE